MGVVPFMSATISVTVLATKDFVVFNGVSCRTSALL